jgi:hypothetical protein
MAGVFMIATSTLALRTGFIARWIAFLGYALSLLLLQPGGSTTGACLSRRSIMSFYGVLRHGSPVTLAGKISYVNGQVSALVEHLFDIDVTKFQR